MTIEVVRLNFVSVTTGDLQAAIKFYAAALAFQPGPVIASDPKLAALHGAERMWTAQLLRGKQILEFAAFDPPGAPYPPDSRANDLWFQHCALSTRDITGAYADLARANFTPISIGGPQRLPASSGGVTVFKFRDPDGHPLELIEFPDRPGAPDGIDHSAISVRDAARSIAFYEGLGLRVGSRGQNAGVAQDALDGLDGVTVDVVALMPKHPAPHIELLAYRAPPGRPAPAIRPADRASARFVLQATGLEDHPGSVLLADGSRAALIHDPDGHALLLREDAP